MSQPQTAALRRAMVLLNNPAHQAVRENINRRFSEMIQNGSTSTPAPSPYYISLSLQSPNLSDTMKTTSHYTANFKTFSNSVALPVFSPSNWLTIVTERVNAQAGISTDQKGVLFACLSLVQVSFDNTKAKRAKSPDIAAGMVAFDIHTQLQTLSAVRSMILDYCAEQGGILINLPTLPNLPR